MAKWSLLPVRFVTMLTVAWFVLPGGEARSACGDHVAVQDPSARPAPDFPPSPPPCQGWWCTGTPAPIPAPAPAPVSTNRPDASLTPDWQFADSGVATRAVEPNPTLSTTFPPRPERPPRA